MDPSSVDFSSHVKDMRDASLSSLSLDCLPSIVSSTESQRFELEIENRQHGTLAFADEPNPLGYGCSGCTTLVHPLGCLPMLLSLRLFLLLFSAP